MSLEEDKPETEVIEEACVSCGSHTVFYEWKAEDDYRVVCADCGEE